MPERAAIITGASSGIGLAIAEVLGETRHGLTVAARRPEKLDTAAEALRRAGHDVEAVAGTGAKILDTRKTTPGWRALEKYAVRCGGGTNHRFDLASAILIKDNHLVECEGDVQLAVRRARDLAAPGTKIEVECDRLEQVEAAIAAKADIVLLDNMSTDVLRQCVALVAGRATIEASGGVNLSTVRAIAETGVDWISIGKLTHSAPALDLALDFD